MSGGGSLRNTLREPLVWAALLGALFLWMDWYTPPVHARTLDIAGQMAIPMMLLTLGVAVARLQPQMLHRAVWLALLRVAICITLTVAIGRCLSLAQVVFDVLIFQLSTPIAVTSYLLA